MGSRSNIYEYQTRLSIWLRSNSKGNRVADTEAVEVDREEITAEEGAIEDVVGEAEDEGGVEGGGAIEVFGLEVGIPGAWEWVTQRFYGPAEGLAYEQMVSDELCEN